MGRRDAAGATLTGRRRRPGRAWIVTLTAWAAATAVGQSDPGAATAGDADRRLEDRSIALWSPYLAWSLPFPDAPGNPFDVTAEVVFTHAETDSQHTTPMFYAGDATWEFRFTATRTGAWSWSSTSEHEALDGWWGEVDVSPNPDPDAHGFLTHVGTRFAVPVDEAGTMAARLYNVHMNPDLKDVLNVAGPRPDDRARIIDAALDDAEAHGFDATFLLVGNHGFHRGAYGYDDHDSVNPSLETFAILEELILAAHRRDLGVHLWMWGDEERRWTPIGVGGIDGTPDRRLQRYLAARLGPLPGWTMSYGFDLEEWVTAEEVRSWQRNVHAQAGWRHLLMARETHAGASGPSFTLGSAKLDVASNDERPTLGFFEVARSELAAAGVPVLFERRFAHTRDGVWDMDTTRRALWQFTLAGGAGAIWGVMQAGDPAYPAPAQLRTHRAFWRDRFALALEPMPGREDASDPYVMRDPDGTRAVAYIEDASAIAVDLSGMRGPLRAVAVDTTVAYRELPVGTLEPGPTVWTAPYRSDWVVAIRTE